MADSASSSCTSTSQMAWKIVCPRFLCPRRVSTIASARRACALRAALRTGLRFCRIPFAPGRACCFEARALELLRPACETEVPEEAGAIVARIVGSAHRLVDAGDERLAKDLHGRGRAQVARSRSTSERHQDGGLPRGARPHHRRSGRRDVRRHRARPPRRPASRSKSTGGRRVGCRRTRAGRRGGGDTNPRVAAASPRSPRPSRSCRGRRRRARLRPKRSRAVP